MPRIAAEELESWKGGPAMCPVDANLLLQDWGLPRILIIYIVSRNPGASHPEDAGVDVKSASRMRYRSPGKASER